VNGEDIKHDLHLGQLDMKEKGEGGAFKKPGGYTSQIREKKRKLGGKVEGRKKLKKLQKDQKKQ